MTPYYDQDGVTIYNGDCLHVLPALPDNSVDLILTDPPYFKVKGDAWDNQWDKPVDFLAWLDRVLAEFARILKPNGSLYLFASPQMGARVECLVAGRFDVLNSITWRKPYSRADGSEKEALRCFFPGSERIVFAEHVGADSAAKGEAGYENKCDKLRGFIFEPIRKYLDDERKASGVPHRTVISHLQMTGHDSHFFSSVQWKLPLADQYAAMRVLFNRSGGAFLRKIRLARTTRSCARTTRSCDDRFLLALKFHTPTCGISRRSATTQVSTSAKNPRPCFGTSYRHLASLARWCSMRLAGLALLQTQPDNLAVVQSQSSFARDGAGDRWRWYHKAYFRSKNSFLCSMACFQHEAATATTPPPTHMLRTHLGPRPARPRICAIPRA